MVIKVGIYFSRSLAAEDLEEDREIAKPNVIVAKFLRSIALLHFVSVLRAEKVQKNYSLKKTQ